MPKRKAEKEDGGSDMEDDQLMQGMEDMESHHENIDDIFSDDNVDIDMDEIMGAVEEEDEHTIITLK